MAPAKIDPLLGAGLEGFGDLEKIFPGRKRHPSRSPPGFPGPKFQNQFPCDQRIKYQTPQKEEPVPGVMTSKEAAEIYGGVQYLEFYRKPPPRRT